MTTTLRYPKGHQFRDENDAPVSGGKLSYYRAGTTTPLETYSDATAQNVSTLSSGAIILDGAGRLAEAIYLGSDYDAKEVLLTNLGASVSPWPDDSIPRAQVFTPADVGYAPPLTASLSLNQGNSPYTLSVNDAGKLVTCSTSGGNLVINLPPASSMTNGQGYWFSKAVAANILTLQGNGTDIIGDFSTYSMSIARQSLAIVSDGTKWIVLFDSDGSVGDFKWFPASTCPAGRLACDGSAISRTTYAALFGAIGTVYGAGDSSTTFNLPDARGEFIRGYDGGGGIDAGRTFGSLQLDALQNITGTIDNIQKQGSSAFAFTGAFGERSDIHSSNGNSSGGSPSKGVDFDASRVARTSTETRPRNLAFLPTIKF